MIYRELWCVDIIVKSYNNSNSRTKTKCRSSFALSFEYLDTAEILLRLLLAQPLQMHLQFGLVL